MNRRLETVSFRDCIYSEDSLYFFSSLNSLPMKQNIKTGEITILPAYSKENLREKAIDLEILHGRNLYALDIRGEYLIKYNIDTYEVSYYEIACFHSVDANFAYMDILDNDIYIFTREAGKFVVFDTGKEEVRSVTYPDVGEDKYICGCKIEKSFFVFPQNGNKILEYAAGENVWRVHKLQENLKRCVHAAIKEDKIYILLEDGTVFQWDVKKETLNKIDYNLPVYSKKNTASRICCTMDWIIILPAKAQDIVQINCNHYEAAIYRDYPANFSYDSDKKHWSKYYGYCENATAYYFACRTSGYILKIEKQSGKIFWIKSEADGWEIEKVNLEKGSTIYEKEGYLECLITRDNNKVADRKRTNIGKTIWRMLLTCKH